MKVEGLVIMVTKTETASVDSAFGFSAKNLPDSTKYPEFKSFPITYSYEYPVFASPEEALNAGFNFVALANTAAKNKAKSNEYQKAISILKPDANDPAEVRKRLVNDLVRLGKSQAEAEALVGSM